MKLLVVDDENISLRGMVRLLTRIYPQAEIVSFQDPITALMLVDSDIDVAFLDIEMPEMNGIELGEELIKKKENLNLIYVTAYEDHALDAFKLHASGYVTKPVTEEQIRTEMSRLRYPMETENDKLMIQCFGNFEVFHKGVPVHFLRSGAKAVLAYLVDRQGASVSIDELCATFWEDSVDIEKKKSYARTMVKSLRQTLDEYKMRDVLVSRRNSYAVNPSMIECDYYRFLQNPKAHEKLFRGEYMSQYSWAERTLGNIVDMIW